MLGDRDRLMVPTLGALMFLTSISTLYKYGGLAGLVIYALLLAAWLACIARLVTWLEMLPARVIYAAFAACFTLIILAFVVGYPLAHSGRLGVGSDRPDALNIPITRSIHWQYPYRAKTYLGDAITPLSGAVLIASPFRLIFGDAAVQNIFWVGAAFALLNRTVRTPQALVVWASIFLLTPEAVHEYVVGGDFMTNGIYVAAAAAFALRSKRRTLSAIALGIAVCSRPDYILVLPLIFLLLRRRVSLLDAIRVAGGAAGVAFLLAAPFYFYSPADFSPLHVTTKVSAGRGLSVTLVLEVLFTLAFLIFLGLRLVNDARRLYLAFAGLLCLAAPLAMIETARRYHMVRTVDLEFMLPGMIFVGMAMADLRRGAVAMPYPGLGRVQKVDIRP